MAAPPLLEVRGLTTEIPTSRGILRAVDGVDLDIHAGEAVALVGESGCGKSMTALSILRLLRPPARIVAGRVVFEGADLVRASEREMRRLRGSRIAMVFQDPMTYLNPVQTVGAQVAEVLRVHQRLAGAAAQAEAARALDRVRLPQPARTARLYPHQLSGGMRQRVMIAMAIACRPALLIADEPTTALDVTIQAQIMRLLAELRAELGGALLLITHDLGLVAETCERVVVMYAAQVVEAASTTRLFAAPRHPYTRGLLRSTLSITTPQREFRFIGGQPPDLVLPPTGCRFHPRCEQATARCAAVAPRLHAEEAGGEVERLHRCDVAAALE
ncbi:MAG: ABC transporter ATP-binding protein [Rubrivivax sp.]|nr:ABC transporter ATP-binding protein [Rubrivivax sp.]